MIERLTEVAHRTWADEALAECLGLYDDPVPVWVEIEAVATFRARPMDGFGPPLVRYEGRDGSAVIQYGWDVWTGYSSAEVLENPGLKYTGREHHDE